MKQVIVTISLAILALMTGCATYAPSVPVGYRGPTAVVMDSIMQHSTSKVDFYYLNKIDGKKIENSRIKSLSDNYGNGFLMNPVVLDRQVPAQEATFEIVARTEYAAPILALSSTVYEVVGVITFTPVRSRIYVVKGSLDEEESSVWIEDLVTQEVMDKKIVIEGSAKLGFWEK